MSRFDDLTASALQNQSSCDLLNRGSQDVVVNRIPDYLGDRDIISFSQTCKFLFFSMHSQSDQALNRFKNLCEFVVKRDHEKAGEILMQHPSLLMRKGELTDDFLDENNNIRKFTEISPLQYAYWAWDAPMLYWMLLYYCLYFVNDHNEAKIEALAWIKLIHEGAEDFDGVTYKLADLKGRLVTLLDYVPEEKKTIGNHLNELEEQQNRVHGSHYDFSSLINPLKIYVENCHNGSEERDLLWFGVRKGQCQTTQQVVHEYCRANRTFYSPKFNDDYLPRKERVYCKAQSWLELVSSVNFDTKRNSAIVRSNYIQAWCVYNPLVEYIHIMRDLYAITRLAKVRKYQVMELVEQLNLTTELKPGCGR